MYHSSYYRRLFAALLLLLAAPAFGAWELDGTRSTVNFVSVKNASIAELHQFKSLSGGIDDSGAARLQIDLDSVETLIPIRNERMREMLFETLQFPSASLSIQVPGELLSGDAGAGTVADIDVELALHGVAKRYTASVVVTPLQDGALQVLLRQPLLINAGDFGLMPGVEALQTVAGLKSISSAVPVTAHLVFIPAIP